MTKFFIVTETENSSPYALVVHNSINVKSYPLSRSANEWAHWVNNENHEITEIVSSLGLNLEYGDSQPVTTKTLEPFKNILPESVYDFVKTLSRQPTIEFTDNVRGYGRRYVVNSDVIHRKRHQRVETKNLIPSVSTNILKRQAYIDRKAMTFRSDNTFSELAFNLKAARAMWDPDLGPSGGWRCPKGSRYGGYITDRFGRGCGGGIIRRVGRALVNAGRGLDNLADRRDRRRLNRAAQRAAKPRGGGNRAERVAQGLERGARRVLGGEEIQTDVANRRVRRNIDRPKPAPQRRGAILPGGGQGVLPRDKPVPQRRGENFVPVYNTIDDELKALDEKLNNLGLGYYSPKQIREMKDRKLHLEEEKRKLGGGAKPPPKRVPKDPVRDFFEERAREEQIPIDGRDPYGRVRPQRRPGSRPVRRPVTENRGRGGEVERRVRPRPERGQGRYAPGWQPGEYKPGDKDRIAQRENRYAKVSTDQLYRALELNAPRDLKPGESADVEARRRQERLEILQELINRDLDIPERYKREAKIYRLKKQRKQGAKPKRNERVARALERAARRIVGGEGGRSREERRQRRMERRAERRERVARALERGAERLVGGDREPRRERAARAMERGAERLVGEDEKRPRSQRERARSAVVEQAQRSPVRKPQRKRRDAAFDALVGADGELDFNFRQALLEDFAALAEEWQKRLGSVPLTREAMDKYIADREGKRAPAFIGSLKAKANDWDVLREYFQKELDAGLSGRDMSPEERLAILEKLGPTRKRKLRERMAANIPAPKSRSERTPSRRPTPGVSAPDRDSRGQSTRAIIEKRQEEINQRIKQNKKIQAEGLAHKQLIEELAKRWPDFTPEQVERAIEVILDDIKGKAARQVGRYQDNRRIRATAAPNDWDPSKPIQFGPGADDVIPYLPDVFSDADFFTWKNGVGEKIREIEADLDRQRSNLNSMSADGVASLIEKEAALDALHHIVLDADYRRRMINNQVLLAERVIDASGAAQRGQDRAFAIEQRLQDNHLQILRGSRRRLPLGESDLLDRIDDLEVNSPDDLRKVEQELDEYIKSLTEEVHHFDISMAKGAIDKAIAEQWVERELRGEQLNPGELRDLRNLVMGRAAAEKLKAARTNAILAKQKVTRERIAMERAMEQPPVNPEPVTPAAPRPSVPASAVPDPTNQNGIDSAMSKEDQRVARPPAGFVPDGMMPRPAERRLPKQRYANLDAAIQHLHRDGGLIADIPDDVLFQAMIYDAVDQNGNPLPPDVFENGFGTPGRRGFKWENARFQAEKIKSDERPGEGVWQVLRIKDKQTGEVWYLKTSEMGEYDGLHEMIGAGLAEAVGFGLNVGNVRLGNHINRRGGKPGRWIMMRDVAQMDAGSDLDGAPDPWKEVFGAPAGLPGQIDPVDAARMAAIDFIANNLDRHGNNFLVKRDKNGKVRIGVIDHGLIGAGRAEFFADVGLIPSNDPMAFLDHLIGLDLGVRDYYGKTPYNANNGIIGLRDHARMRLDTPEKKRIFREQVIKVVEHLEANFDKIVSQRIIEAGGAKLTPEEKRYFDRYTELMRQRLRKLATQVDDLVRLLS